MTDVEAAAAKARDAATRAGGYTGSERSGPRGATLTLTVPGEKLDSTLDELQRLGKKKTRELTVDDLTESVVDVDSRIKSQRKSVARARELLDRAQSIDDISTVESELAERESELESLLARQESLRGQAAMAPITLSISDADVQAGTDDDDTGFLAGLTGGWDAFTTTMGVLAQVLGATLPFLLVFGIPAGLLVWLLRRRIKPQAEAS